MHAGEETQCEGVENYSGTGGLGRRVGCAGGSLNRMQDGRVVKLYRSRKCRGGRVG